MSSVEDAELFYKKPENQREQDNEAMHNLIGSRYPNSFLEIGCGSGDMLNRYDNARGIDINTSMVEFAQKRGNDVVLGDVTDKAFMNQYTGIDVIAANYVFTELTTKQIDPAFKNIHGALASEGTFYFTITNPKSDTERTYQVIESSLMRNSNTKNEICHLLYYCKMKQEN